MPIRIFTTKLSKIEIDPRVKKIVDLDIIDLVRSDCLATDAIMNDLMLHVVRMKGSNGKFFVWRDVSCYLTCIELMGKGLAPDTVECIEYKSVTEIDIADALTRELFSFKRSPLASAFMACLLIQTEKFREKNNMSSSFPRFIHNGHKETEWLKKIADWDPRRLKGPEKNEVKIFDDRTKKILADILGGDFKKINSRANVKSPSQKINVSHNNQNESIEVKKVKGGNNGQPH